MTHDSLLIVTWDENDDSPGNQIPTILAGQPVRPGRYGQPITHYSVLRTLEALYRLPLLGHAATATVSAAAGSRTPPLRTRPGLPPPASLAGRTGT